MDYSKLALEYHKKWRGKIEMVSRVPLTTKDDLSIAYTPGVAEPCLQIKDNPDLSYTLTRRWNTIAVVTDGTAVLGLGDIGPLAGMPVMEGKCVLFKQFGDIDAIPLCIDSKNTDDIVNTIRLLQGSFGGINLEDIAAPRCFEIEAKLKGVCDIPIFHDDQHGTAVVALAALQNALKITDKRPCDVSIVISGAGAAGTSIAKLILKSGFSDVTLCDIEGALTKERTYTNNELQALADETNPQNKKGTLADVLVGADIFIGVSAPNIVTEEMIQSMAKSPIVFAMANPTPEIHPDLARRAGARIVATGRSDFPNQINNVLAFPGIFRGALDCRAADINDEMKLAAAHALAALVTDQQRTDGIVIPSPFYPDICQEVAKAVVRAAIASGVARIIPEQ